LGLVGGASFDLYIVLSPQGAGAIFPANAWSGLGQPILSLTGTRDEELGGGAWQVRTEPYRNMSPGCKWLGVIADSTHMQFAGIGASKPTEMQVSWLIGAFVDARRRGDCTAPRAQAGVTLESK
jgi:hypothetical protein